MKDPCFKRQGFYFSRIHTKHKIDRQKSHRLPIRLEKINKVDSTFAPSKIQQQEIKTLRQIILGFQKK